MRLLLSILITLLLTAVARALAVQGAGNDELQRRDPIEIPSTMMLAVVQSASALAAAYVSSLNEKINAPQTTPTPTTTPTLPTPPPAAGNPTPPSPPPPAITSTTTPTAPIAYAWTSYTTVATVTNYIWTGTGTPTGWPFVTTTALPTPAPAEGAAPAMLVSGIFTTMVAVVFSAIIMVIVV